MRERAVSFELPQWDALWRRRAWPLELVVVALQIAHQLLHLDRGLVGQPQDAVATFRVEQGIERQTNPGSAPEESRLAAMFFAGAFRFLFLLLARCRRLLGRGVRSGSGIAASCDARQKRRLPLAWIVSAR